MAFVAFFSVSYSAKKSIHVWRICQPKEEMWKVNSTGLSSAGAL
jgi:hypothetical protein